MITCALLILALGVILTSVPFIVKLIYKFLKYRHSGAYGIDCFLILTSFYLGILCLIISFLLFVRYL